MDENLQLWVRPVSAETLNFERLFKYCLCLRETTSGQNFRKLVPYLWEKRLRNSPKGGFMDAASPQKHLNIYNLTATNAKLMKCTTSMYLHKKLNLAEDWGVTHRA